MKYVEVKTGKSTAHEGKVLDFLKATRYPGVDFLGMDINQRIKQIKKGLSFKG